jgi:hypothetical protein
MDEYTAYCQFISRDDNKPAVETVGWTANDKIEIVGWISERMEDPDILVLSINVLRTVPVEVLEV